MEIWKDIKGYEGLYAISNMGKVKSFSNWVDIGLGRKQFKPERILKAGVASNGYYTVSLCKKSLQITRTIHSLIGEAFIPNPKGVRCVNHKDGNKLNNNVENLEWVTDSENHKHAYSVLGRKPFRKINTDQVTQIRALKKLGLKVAHLCAMYSTNQSTVSNIINLKTRLNG